jgi:magnesium transporter
MTTTGPIETSALSDEWPSMPAEERSAVFRGLPHGTAEAVFAQLGSADQADLLARLPMTERRIWARTLAPDDAADCIQAAPPADRDELLAALDEPARREVTALLAYAEDEAGGLMNPQYARLRPEMRVDEAIAFLRRQAVDRLRALYYAYVLDAGNRLVGVISVTELFAAPASRTVSEVMVTDVVRVTEHADQEDVARLLARHDLVAVPVVDAEDRIVGIVAVDDVLDVVGEEATEDIQKVGGTKPLDRPYLRTPLPRLIAHRGTWLGALFVGEMLTASAMGRYQDDIARTVALAVFVPLIISSGGNSGSQATTLVIRAMALGEVRTRDFWKVLSRETACGLALGVFLAAVGLARILAWQGAFGSYGDLAPQLAAIVAVSLVGIVAWGTITGAMLPFALRAAGLDPASASAPLVATLVDVAGIVIYFTVARAVLGGIAG